LALFNAYRAATYPDGWPRSLKLNTDTRGTLFEAVKGGGGGQAFFSTTEPGVTRGDHFHLNKVERFLVVQGDAVIRIRKVLTDKVWDYGVSGDTPMSVDMPTLHTHSIENFGPMIYLTRPIQTHSQTRC
jgi:UDP-2-acetamido-2,6-beta-L-arabino-hexul-4-ose reductase